MYVLGCRNKMNSQHINFTKKAIEKLPVPSREEKQYMYYDTGCQDGLCIIVTYGGTKTFYFFMKFQGSPKRVKIGRVGHIELSDARAMAHTLREDATKNGQDPSEKRRNNLKDMMLGRFYQELYLPNHSQIHKRPVTIENDNSIFKKSLADLHNRKMMSITREDVVSLHNRLMKKISPYTANRMLSLLQHIYTKAFEWGYPKQSENPTDNIKKFKEHSRDRYLKPDELERFFEALKNCHNEMFRNFVLLSLFLGQRRSNILSMRWRNIDLENGFVLFPDTKNGEPIQTPITSHVLSILKDMKKYKTNDWVFPSDSSKSGHFEEPKSSWKTLLKNADIENLRLHDLRRTMGSYQAIGGTSLHVIGKTMGHKSNAATRIYARLSADPVRESMQRATDKMLGILE